MFKFAIVNKHKHTMAKARDYSDRDKKKLYALSGNECANPLCHNKLVYPDDNAKNDQICHIEAASPDGPRYNPNQTDDERRDFDNLILLCHKCHDMIDNNPDKYTVEILKKWKQEHEAKYKTSNKDKVFHFYIPDGLLPRDKEADFLYNSVISNRCFNLVGVGGSGKSSLAFLMMQKHEKNFNETAYVVVNNNIKDDFVEQINKTLRLEFEKDDDSFSELIAHLQNNFKSEHPNLLALDINETSDKNKNDEITNKIIKNKDILNGWKILILSRENVDTRNRIDTHNLNDQKDVVFLKELFLSKAGTRYDDFDDFAELFKIVFYNPLLAEQLGLYLNDEPELATIDNIKKILYGESFREEDMQGLSADRHDEPIVSFLTNLIKYNDLNDNEKNLLRHFVLWQAEYIVFEVIKDLLKGVFESDDDLKNALKSLSKRSILDTNKDKTLSYKLHGLLAESLRAQIDIDNETYDVYLNNIKRIIEYTYHNFLPYADCIGNSLSEYFITKDYQFIYDVAYRFQKAFMFNYANSLFKNASITIQRIIQNTIKNNPKDQNFLAVLYRDLAYLEENTFNDSQSAESNYNKAIIIRRQLPKDDTENQNDLASLYNEIANLQARNLINDKSKIKYSNEYIKYREQLSKDNPNYQSDLASLYNEIALLQARNNQNAKSAITNYNNAIEIREQLPKSNHKYQKDLACLYCDYAHLQAFYFEDYQSAEINFQKAKDICEQLSKTNHEYHSYLASLYNDYARFQASLFKDYKSADTNYQKAIDICEQLPKDNPEYQNNLARQYSIFAYFKEDQLKDYKSAETNYQKAVDIREKLPKDNPIYQNVLIETYNDLVRLQYNELKDYKSAETNYQKEIGIREQLPKDNPKYQYSLSYAYDKLAALQINHLKDYKSAEKNYYKVIEIRELLPKSYLLYLKDLACAYLNLAVLQKEHLGDYQSAESNYKKTIEIRELLPQNTRDYQKDLAYAYNAFADFQSKCLNNYESAQDNYHKAIDIFERLLPHWYYLIQEDLAKSYHNLAMLQAYHIFDLTSAESNYKKSIDYCEQMVTDEFRFVFIDKIHINKGLAMTYNNFSKFYASQHRFDDAIAMASKAIDIAQNVADKDSTYLIDLIKYKHTLAEIYFATNEIDSAKSILSEITPQAEKCLAENPNDECTKTVNKDINDLLAKINQCQ